MKKNIEEKIALKSRIVVRTNLLHENGMKRNPTHSAETQSSNDDNDSGGKMQCSGKQNDNDCAVHANDDA